MCHRVIALSAALVALALPLAHGSPAAAAATPAPQQVTALSSPVGTSGPTDPPAPHERQRSTRHAEVSRDADRSPAATSTDPLALTIDELTPSSIPARGEITVSGQVTNEDDATWSTINVYAFVSDEPMTSPDELAEATQAATDTYVGQRVGVNDQASYHASIDSLAPGESATYSFSVPRKLLAATVGHDLTPGVYWFGVHALGQGPEGRDNYADGRARTFLPLVPQRATGRIPVSVVLPLRRPVVYADDGSLADADGWLQTLSEGGRLRSLVDLGDTAGGRPVSWLVDPALVDAVRRLAAGNPPRSIAANLARGQSDNEPDATSTPTPGGSTGPSGDTSVTVDPDPTSTDDPSATPATGSGTDGEPEALAEQDLAQLDPTTRTVARAAQDWLARLTAAVQPGDELLVLPYGDTDVSGAARHDATVYRVARARSSRATVLPGLAGVQVVPAVGSPSGFLNATALDLVDADTTTLITDRMFSESPPTLLSADGHDLVVSSAAAAGGGPGPDDPTAVVAMRQRMLAEAALRFLGTDPQPLVVMLPHDWNPQDASGFFAGLDATWLDLATVADATGGTTPAPVATDDVRYPASQTAAELDAANFDAAGQLMSAGTALQSLLSRNDVVAGTVADEALATTSYSARTHPDASRVAADRARSWIDARLRQVTVTAPPAVTLSSSSGQFTTTITNGLDQPVTVTLQARTDDRLRIGTPRRIEVPPHGSVTKLLDARTHENGVHQVTLRVTDKRGVALGGTTQLSIRSAQVSGVIWLFLGLGAVLLFGTIVVRLFRRVLAARREARGGTPSAGRSAGAPGRPDRPAPPQPAGAGRR